MTSAPARVQDAKPAAALQAILLEAEVAGVPKPTRTALVMYLYLLDVFYAEETGGQTWTGLTWRFHNFGPFSDAAVATLDRLVEQGLVEQEEIATRNCDYFLCQLGEWSKAVSLAEPHGNSTGLIASTCSLSILARRRGLVVRQL